MINVSVDIFKFLPTKFAACSKPPIRDNHRKAVVVVVAHIYLPVIKKRQTLTC